MDACHRLCEKIGSAVPQSRLSAQPNLSVTELLHQPWGLQPISQPKGPTFLQLVPANAGACEATTKRETVAAITIFFIIPRLLVCKKSESSRHLFFALKLYLESLAEIHRSQFLALHAFQSKILITQNSTTGRPIPSI
jgi:hypothetical protein